MKKYIKVLSILFIALITFIGVGVSVSADTGPKPYVTITVEGNTTGMYMTLLSKGESSGPWYPDRRLSEDENTEIHQKFDSYQDSDGFYYLRYYGKITNNSFEWRYMPPYEFKILIYDSVNDKFITNNIVYERYAFASTYKLVLSNDSFIVSKNMSFGPELLNFFVRLTLCLAIEIGLAYLFGFRRKELLLFLYTNIGTQVILNVLLTVFIYFDGYQPFGIIGIYVLSEVFILLIESTLHLLFLQRIDLKNGYNLKNPAIIIIYTLLANLLSLGLGFVILTYLPKF